MAYSKQTWNTGDTITANKLNHMEDGIGNSMQYPENAYFVNLLYNIEGDYDSDKTFSEITQAYDAGKIIYGNFRHYIPGEYDSTMTVKLEPLYDSSTIICFQQTNLRYIDYDKMKMVYESYSIYDDGVGGYAITIDNPFFPSVPGSNGTYVLKGTKTSDSFTYSWVAE